MRTPFIDRVQEAAADIAATAPGIAMPDYAQLAEETLANLVGWRPTYSARQDIDYLGRILQAVAELGKGEGS